MRCIIEAVADVEQVGDVTKALRAMGLEPKVKPAPVDWSGVIPRRQFQGAAPKPRKEEGEAE